MYKRQNSAEGLVGAVENPRRIPEHGSGISPWIRRFQMCRPID